MSLNNQYLRAYAVKDDAHGNLAAGISAGALVFSLGSAEGLLFPTTYNGTTDDAGTDQVLELTGVGALGITVGMVIHNITDGSWAAVTVVNTDSLTTTKLQGGSDDTWELADDFCVNPFIVTAVQYATTGDETTAIVKKEKILMNYKSTDDFYVNAAGRGFDGSTAAIYDTGDDIYIFVKAVDLQAILAGVIDHEKRIQDIEDDTTALLRDGSRTINNNTYLQARNNADAADVDIVKLNASDEIEFASTPKGPAADPTDDDEFARKKYVDDTVAGVINPQAGEDIDGSSTPVLSFISNGVSASDMCGTQRQMEGKNTDVDIYGVRYYGQQITLDSYDNKITGISLLVDKVGAPAGNFVVTLYALDGSGHPTGAALATSTVSASTIGTADYVWHYFAFAAEYDATPGTQYGVVCTTISGDASNYVRWFNTSGSLYSGGAPLSSVDAGTTWAVNSNDHAFILWSWEEQTQGEVYITDPDNGSFRGDWDGFVTSNTLSGALVDMRVNGIQGSLTLTAGETYHTSGAGGLATSGGLSIGKAVSTTEIELDKSNRFVRIAEISHNINSSDTDISLYEADFICGFKPSKVDIYLLMTAHIGAASNQRLGHFPGQVHGSLFYGMGVELGNDTVAATESKDGSGVSTLEIRDGTNAMIMTADAFTLKEFGFAMDVEKSGSSGSGTFTANVIAWK
jgi:hypothetical protein